MTLNDFKTEELEVAKLAKFECGMLRLKISNSHHFNTLKKTHHDFELELVANMSPLENFQIIQFVLECVSLVFMRTTLKQR